MTLNVQRPHLAVAKTVLPLHMVIAEKDVVYQHLMAVVLITLRLPRDQILKVVDANFHPTDVVQTMLHLLKDTIMKVAVVSILVMGVALIIKHLQMVQDMKDALVKLISLTAVRMVLHQLKVLILKVIFFSFN